MAGEDGRLPYFPFYPGDYLSSSKVARMTLEEQGAFVRLLCYQWRDGPLPEDLKQLAPLCNVPVDTMEELWESLEPAFEKRDGGVVNPRLYRERRRIEEKREKLSEAGKRGARKRWSSREENGVASGDPNGEANGVAMAYTESESESEEQTTEGSSLRSSPSGGAGVENSGREPWNDRLAPLIRKVAYAGKGPAEGHDLDRCLSKASQLLDRGHAMEDLEDAIRGLRLMAKDRDPRVRQWIRAEDRFTMLVFGRAKEQGIRLVKEAAHYWRKSRVRSRDGTGGVDGLSRIDSNLEGLDPSTVRSAAEESA